MQIGLGTGPCFTAYSDVHFAGGSELDSVRGKIYQNLAQPVAVAYH